MSLPTNFVISPLRRAEIPSAAAVARKSFGGEYAQNVEMDLAAMFGKSPVKPTYLAARIDGRLVGFAGFAPAWTDYNLCQIFWVTVAPPFQRRGIGRKLMRSIIAEIRRNREIELIELVTHSPAYYEQFGFKTVKRFGNKKARLMCLDI